MKTHNNSGKIFLRLLLLVVLGVGLTQVDAYLKMSQPPQKVDALVYLGGGAGERMLKALQLYEAGYASRILITSPKPTDPRLKNFYANCARRFLVGRGVVLEDVFIISNACDTYAEALQTANFIEKKRWNSVMIISDPYHMRRVKLYFDRVFLPRGLKPIYVAADVPWMDKPWYSSGRQMKYVFLETIKLAKFYIQSLFI